MTRLKYLHNTATLINFGSDERTR